MRAPLVASLCVACLALSVPGLLAQTWADPPETAEEQTLRAFAADDATIDRLRETGLVLLPRDCAPCPPNPEDDTSAYRATSYITADCMLYLWHEAYCKAMLAVETQWLAPRLQRVCRGLLEATRSMRQEGDADLLRRNAVMLQTACKLLDPTAAVAPDLAQQVATEVAGAAEPVGLYVTSPQASGLYRAAAYLRAASFAITDRDDPAEADRRLRQALLLCLALQSRPELLRAYTGICSLRRELEGAARYVGLDELAAAAHAAWGDGWEGPIPVDLTAVREELAGRGTPDERGDAGPVGPRWPRALRGPRSRPRPGCRRPEQIGAVRRLRGRRCEARQGCAGPDPAAGLGRLRPRHRPTDPVSGSFHFRPGGPLRPPAPGHRDAQSRRGWPSAGAPPGGAGHPRGSPGSGRRAPGAPDDARSALYHLVPWSAGARAPRFRGGPGRPEPPGATVPTLPGVPGRPVLRRHVRSRLPPGAQIHGQDPHRVPAA